MHPRARTSLFLSHDSVEVSPACSALGRLSPACLLPRERISLLFSVAPLLLDGVPPPCFLGRVQTFHLRNSTLGGRSPASLLPLARTPHFFRDSASSERSPACLLPRVRTSLFLSSDTVGVPPACFLGQGKAFSFRVFLSKSRQLASSGED